MKHAAHLILQGGVDDLVLLHPRLAAKGLGNDLGRMMVAVAREILECPRARQAGRP
jgi:hypothetical protein